MVSTENREGKEEVQEELGSIRASNGIKAKSPIPPYVSPSQKGLLSDGHCQEGFKATFLRKLQFLKIKSDGGLTSLTAKIRGIAEVKDGISRSIHSSSAQNIRVRFNGVIARKMDWAHLQNISKEWIKNPFNMALLLWITCVAISGAILFLVMTGMLNGVLQSKSQRNAWFEVNNQILNALFTLMCLYQHPKRFHHFVLLCRWNPKDISTLRKIYCKNGTYKPNEWTHMMIVVILLHINCFAQYALCGLNLGFKRSERPALGVGICISIAIAAPAIAGVYTIVSPLGKEYDYVDEEAQDHILQSRRNSLEKRFSFASRHEQRLVESSPQWRGGLFDIWDDISTAYLSLFCSFCVFGWNMERLGFGNMYVHIATFLLFCMAPFWIFNLAAITIDDETVREALGVTGIILCVFGLLYGGFWRIQMRKRFNLPSNNVICGKPGIADCTQWLFCCWCSLAQEVRTADFYDIVEDKFCRKQASEISQQVLSPLPREDGVCQFRSGPSSPLGYERSSSPSKLRMKHYSSPNKGLEDFSSPDGEVMKLEEEYSERGVNESMKPPGISLIRRDDSTDQ